MSNMSLEDSNKDVWIEILDQVRHEYLDKLLLETLPMSPEKVQADHNSWIRALNKGQ